MGFDSNGQMTMLGDKTRADGGILGLTKCRPTDEVVLDLIPLVASFKYSTMSGVVADHRIEDGYRRVVVASLTSSWQTAEGGTGTMGMGAGMDARAAVASASDSQFSCAGRGRLQMRASLS
jgi:hypothetical protein